MHKTKILIVDDSKDMHQLIEFTLEDIEIESDSSNHGDERKEYANEIEIISSFQGEEGYHKVQQSVENNEPFSVAIVDMHMPPGWDGIQTIEKIREIDHNIQIVICSAFADTTWEDISERLGAKDRYLFISKPFDPMELKQMITALANKWSINRRNNEYISELKQAAMEAQSGKIVKEEFLNIMNHELRTPLNIIQLTLDELKDRDSDAEQIELIENSQMAAKRLGSLVDGIMEYISFDESNFLLEDKIDIRQILGELTTKAKSKTKNKKLILKSSIDKNIPKEVLGNRSKVKQLLWQLISNGIKFTNEGSVSIGATNLEKGPPDKTTIRLSVEDTGIGIEEKNQSKIFDLFFQVECSQNHTLEGTGVGLSIAKKIVNILGGKIGVESKLNVGSRFWIDLSFDK